MAATFDFEQYSGSATGSPAVGTTLTTGCWSYNWKSVDGPDSTYTFTTYPISAGNNSYTIYGFGKWSGTFTQIQSVLWALTAGTLGAGLTVQGVVTSTYATPSSTTNSALTVNMTTPIAISSGQTVLISTSSPAGASPASSTTTSPSYSQFMAHQLQTTSSATAGNTATCTFTVQYLEN